MRPICCISVQHGAIDFRTMSKKSKTDELPRRAAGAALVAVAFTGTIPQAAVETPCEDRLLVEYSFLLPRHALDACYSEPWHFPARQDHGDLPSDDASSSSGSTVTPVVTGTGHLVAQPATISGAGSVSAQPGTADLAITGYAPTVQIGCPNDPSSGDTIVRSASAST